MMAIVLMAILAFPITANATIFWDDEMESGNTGYTLPGNGGMSYDTSVKFSGNGSTRYNYPTGVCYPDANAQVNCGGFMDRTFTSTATFYRRVYFMMSVGFTVSDIFTKMFRSDTENLSTGYTGWWTMGCCGDKLWNVGLQNVPSFGAATTVDSTFTFSDGQWYCLETREVLNTPGVSNGILQAWVDGVLVMDRSDILYRQSGDTSLFNNNRMYRQTGQGSLWFDRLAVGDTRIGCLGGGGSTAGGGLDF